MTPKRQENPKSNDYTKITNSMCFIIKMSNDNMMENCKVSISNLYDE